MNAVFAAVLLAVVATVSGTQVYSTLGSQYLYAPSTSLGYQYQYVQPSTYQYQYQPVVAGSSVVSSSVPAVTYANSYVPSVSTLGYASYPYAYNYGYGLNTILKK